jgi:SAM-dependent methyltransferase
MNPVPNFDRLARLYRWLEYLTFGPFLLRCRVHFLVQLRPYRRALILGDGDGRFTSRLLRDNLKIRVHAVDASPDMLKTLRRIAVPHQDRLTTEAADIRIWQPADSPPNSPQYDLVVTHFFLDCLTTHEVSDLANRLAPALHPEASWLISEFAVPSTLFGRAIAAPLVAVLYRAFRWLTGLRIDRLPDHVSSLANAGWCLQSEHRHLNGLLLSQVWHRPASLPNVAESSSTPNSSSK